MAFRNAPSAARNSVIDCSWLKQQEGFFFSQLRASPSMGLGRPLLVTKNNCSRCQEGVLANLTQSPEAWP